MFTINRLTNPRSNMNNLKKAVILLIFATIHASSIKAFPQPLQSDCPNCITKDLDKKGIFVSRGWGAGGMPFGVLYMSPSYSTSKSSHQVPISKTIEEKNRRKSVPSHIKSNNMSSRQKVNRNIPHSVIPQLFVSYGWGPLGK